MECCETWKQRQLQKAYILFFAVIHWYDAISPNACAQVTLLDDKLFHIYRGHVDVIMLPDIFFYFNFIVIHSSAGTYILVDCEKLHHKKYHVM